MSMHDRTQKYITVCALNLTARVSLFLIFKVTRICALQKLVQASYTHAYTCKYISSFAHKELAIEITYLQDIRAL